LKRKKKKRLFVSTMAEGMIPIVDISAFLAVSNNISTESDLANYPAARSVVDQIRDACERIGFLIITGHGVSGNVISDAFRASRDFFDLPVAAKREVPMTNDWPYGYSGLEEEHLSKSYAGQGESAPDLKETFQMCLNPESQPRWPSQPAHLQSQLTNYYEACVQLSRQMLRIFALALHLSADFFENKVDRHWSALRVLNYPEQQTAPKPGQIRASAHADYGTLTILRQDDSPGGLQVLNKDGSWQDVVTRGMDAYIINIGDLMQRWTDDKWKSTIHRVVNPVLQPGQPNRRQSMAFFHNLNKDAEVSSIGGGNKYPSIKAGDYLMMKHRQSMGVKE
jgi:isopenicillin N synthase-like dioxygenase